MARVRMVSIDGEDFTVPDRVSGDDGPEIEIVVCATGEFIDGGCEELSFMQRPEPPEFVKLEVVQGGHVGVDVGHATDEELRIAKSGKSWGEVMAEIWGHGDGKE